MYKTILSGIVLASTLFISCKKELDINAPGNLVPRTVADNPGLPSIAVNGTVLHAETYGKPGNPIVLFLHGGPGADYRNALKVKQLADDGYFVVFYDQRGSGLSKRHDKSTYSIQLMFDDLEAVIAHYKSSPQQKVFLFGHSWGAMLAAGFINTHPGRIDGVIFAEAGGLNKAMWDTYSESSRRAKLFSETTNDILYYDQFLTGKENDHAILDYKLGIASSYTYAAGNDEGIEGPSPFWRNGAVVLNALTDIALKDGFDFTTHLSHYTTKVLFLYSENNRSHGLAFSEKEAAFFPDHEIVRIDGTGHEMIYFKWESVYPVVLKYLNSLK